MPPTENGGSSPALPPRDEALALMHEYTASESLRKHMLAVEAAMRAYAVQYGEDPERWGLAGLIHDFDYERFPNASRSPTDEHPSAGVGILRERGWPADILDAIMGHAAYYWRAAGDADGESAVRRRRAVGTHHRDGARQADPRACTTWTPGR